MFFELLLIYFCFCGKNLWGDRVLKMVVKFLLFFLLGVEFVFYLKELEFIL